MQLSALGGAECPYARHSIASFVNQGPSQLIVVTHAAALAELLRDAGGVVYELLKEAGEPQTWTWPSR